jgi:hypothetical protein
MDYMLTLSSGMADYEPVIAASPGTTNCTISHVFTCCLHHLCITSSHLHVRRPASGVSHDRLSPVESMSARLLLPFCCSVMIPRLPAMRFDHHDRHGLAFFFATYPFASNSIHEPDGGGRRSIMWLTALTSRSRGGGCRGRELEPWVRLISFHVTAARANFINAYGLRGRFPTMHRRWLRIYGERFEFSFERKTQGVGLMVFSLEGRSWVVWSTQSVYIGDCSVCRFCLLVIS